jgi:hypothetical protein
MMPFSCALRLAARDSKSTVPAHRSSITAGTAVLLPLTLWMGSPPGTAAAAIVNGTFSGTLNDSPSSNFASNGFSSSEGDTVNGRFTFDTSNITGSFSATLDDTTSGDTFTLPAGAASTATASVTSSDYTVSTIDPLEFPTTHTAFTATFSLDLSNPGALIAGDLTQTAAFLGGTGSLEIDVPTAPGGPLDQTIGFTLDAATVPEPASIGLFGFAFAGLLVGRRARRPGQSPGMANGPR